MLLIHDTEKVYADDIRKNGMNAQGRQAAYQKHLSVSREYRLGEKFINECPDILKNGFSFVDRSAGHYFLFDYDTWITHAHIGNLHVCVDVEKLDHSKLFVGNTALLMYLYAELNGTNNVERISNAVMWYWKLFYRFDEYVARWKEIGCKSIEQTGIPYAAEVIYCGDILPEHIAIKNNIGRKMSMHYEKYKALVNENLFNIKSVVHGVRHTLNVMGLADMLADSVGMPERDRELLMLCAACHDIGRENDIDDQYHGRKSVQRMHNAFPELFNGFSVNEVGRIENVIESHSYDVKYSGNDPVMLCLLDADALDRVRFNGLNPHYLRLPGAMSLIMVAKEWNR